MMRRRGGAPQEVRARAYVNGSWLTASVLALPFEERQPCKGARPGARGRAARRCPWTQRQ